jgi:hypothetical protein
MLHWIGLGVGVSDGEQTLPLHVLEQLVKERQDGLAVVVEVVERHHAVHDAIGRIAKRNASQQRQGLLHSLITVTQTIEAQHSLALGVAVQPRRLQILREHSGLRLHALHTELARFLCTVAGYFLSLFVGDCFGINEIHQLNRIEFVNEVVATIQVTTTQRALFH